MEAAKDLFVPGQSELEMALDGLPDFKTIADFEEAGNVVALVSHPGWKSHHIEDDKIYEIFYERFSEMADHELENTGTHRAKQIAIAYLYMKRVLDARHIILEKELFEYLTEHDLPVIVTVPMINEGQNFEISPAISQDYPNYLQDIKGDMDNFYILPTQAEPEEAINLGGRISGEEERKTEVLDSFLDAIKGKDILLAGSNIFQCFDTLLAYTKCVETSVTVLMNYCGVNNLVTKKTKDLPAPELQKSVIRTVKENPGEPQIIEYMARFFPHILESAVNGGTLFPYAPLETNDISSFTGYVQDLKLD